LVEDRHFFIPYLHLTPLLEDPRWNIAIRLGTKTRMVGLPDGEKSLRICLLLSTEYTRTWQTPRRTDGHRTTA